MANPEVKSGVLIESPPSESKAQFRAYVTELLTSIYGRIPDWLEFKVGRRVMWRDTQFREFLFVAGSVGALLMLHASRTAGISRGLFLHGSSPSGGPASKEICDGIEREIDPEELQLLT